MKKKQNQTFDFDDYAQKCKFANERGTENSFYTAFENLLNHIFAQSPDYQIINNPISEKKEGHPDFQCEKNKIPFLRIEAKPPKYDIIKWLNSPDCDKDALRMSNQLHKYLRRVDMILLVTDFKTIYWIDSQEMSDSDADEIPIKYEFKILNDDFTLHVDLESDFIRFKNLLALDLESVRSDILTLLDHIMPHINELRKEFTRIIDKPENREEIELKKHMREILSDLKKSMFNDYAEDFKTKFIDLYTQVIAYGLFMAWIRFNKGHRKSERFNLDIVSRYLPKNSLMQNLFGGIKNHLTDTLIDNVFNPILKWFNKTDYEELANMIDELMNEFYSGFLEKYDKKVKKEMGVVYTPKEVVDFMVRGVDHFLINTFKLRDGILDPSVKYLDPSAGTMAYPCSLMELAYHKICEKVESDPNSFGTDLEKKEKFSEWFRKSFIRKQDGFANVFGFEILMAPYILGSLRVLMTAEKLGAKVDYAHDKIQMYLMNTLMDYPEGEELENFLIKLENPHVKNELKDSLDIRKKEDIMVLFTNPPYNVSSQNSSKWITKLVNDYIKPENLAREKGKPQIKKIQGLASAKDDYWKFLRFAQWKIAENGEKHGIVSFITNNFYLDGIVARGLRKEYMRAFDKIFIVNLNGDWRKKIPESTNVKADGNIFDVNCGIAIIFAIRLPKEEHRKNKGKGLYNCEVLYKDLWGTPESKLDYLKVNSIENMEFDKVGNNLDFEFTPHIQVDVEYQNFPYLCEIFKKNINGIKTGHDHELMGVRHSECEEKIKELFDKYSDNPPDLPKISWNPKNILKANLEKSLKKIIEWDWRGFDKRWLCYDPNLMQSHRFSILQYLLPHQNNMGLVVNRVLGKDIPSSYLISDNIIEHKINEGASGQDSYSFPLKINNSSDKDDFNNPKPAIHSNISKKFLKSLPYWDTETIDVDHLAIGEQIFYYVYGILYAPTYRESYKGLLSKDFPRVPFPNSYELFQKMRELGRKIAKFHLLKDKEVQNIKRRTTNINELETSEYKILKYAWIEGKIYFNTKKKEVDTTHLIIEDVSKEVWEFEIGGIKQLDNWLKARRFSAEPKKNTIQRGIIQDELKYFLRVINAIEDTLNNLDSIDKCYNEIANDLHEFQDSIDNLALDSYIKKRS